jgi:RNA polymerase primary sigma factor
MSSVARIQLLRAALELGTFTVKDLANETAIPLESVRTALKRQARLTLEDRQFVDAGEESQVATPRQTGRPARRYRLRDPDGARREVEAVSGLPGGSPPVEQRPDAQSEASVLDLALANLHTALTDDLDEASKAARIDTARRTAEVVLRREGSADPVRARAHEYIAGCHIARGLLLCEDEDRLAAFAVAAEHGFAALELDSVVGHRVVRLLVAGADKARIDPPIGEMLASPIHDVGLFRGEVEDVAVAGQLFRVPRYASELMRARSPAGVVVRVGAQDSERTVQQAFEGVREFNVPTYVALSSELEERFTEAVQRIALRNGAYWIPVESPLDDALTVSLANALDKVHSREDRVLLDAIDALPTATASPGGEREQPPPMLDLKPNMTTDLLQAFEEFGEVRRLTAEEEVELAQLVERGEERAKQKMVESNLRLVVSVAKSYRNQGMPFFALVQKGTLGLMRAAESFDYRKGFRFATYATWWIRQAIVRSLVRDTRIPQVAVSKLGAIEWAERELVTKLGREPTTEEIAKMARLECDEVEEIKRLSQGSVSPGKLVVGEDESELRRILPDEQAESRYGHAAAILARNVLWEAFERLSNRERRVLELRYGLRGEQPPTLDEIERKFNDARGLDRAARDREVGGAHNLSGVEATQVDAERVHP